MYAADGDSTNRSESVSHVDMHQKELGNNLKKTAINDSTHPLARAGPHGRKTHTQVRAKQQGVKSGKSQSSRLLTNWTH